MYIFVLTIGTKQTMSETTKNKKIYNTEILTRLMEKYGLSKRYITMSLSGERISETSEKIKSDYRKANEAICKILESI